jgi:protein phosphatase
VTRDHSLVAEQVAAGAMTEQEARESQHRNIITRALGHRQRVDVDVFEIRLLPEDRLLLTSDGLHDYVDENEMVQTSLGVHPEDAARQLVAMALEHGSNDNVSAVIAWMAPSGVPTERPAEVPPAERGSNLIPLIVLIGIVVFIAVIVLVLYLG